jgi:aspartate/glutamate racemase
VKTIGVLLNQANCPLPVFDTTLLHVGAALDWAFGSECTAGPG